MKRALFILLAAAVAACGSSKKKTPDAGPWDSGWYVPDAGGDDGGADGGGLADGGDGGAHVDVKLVRVEPPRGPTGGGTNVVLSGSGFVYGYAQVGDPTVKLKTQIYFGSNEALDFSVIDDDTIQVVTPSGVAGDEDVRVVNPNGVGTCAACFTYYEPVMAGAISPASGPARGGTAVAITGSGFTPDTFAVIGGRELISPVVVDGQHLTGLTPPGEPGAPRDVRVMNKNGLATLRESFTYLAAPKVTEIDSPGAPVAGGAQVTLVGEGLSTATSVTFGGAAATALSPADDQHLALTVPAHAAGPVDVAVTTPQGVFTYTGGFAYYDPAASGVALFAVSPPRGPLGGGNVVTLVGENLDLGPNPQATFGGVTAVVTVTSADFASATVPAGSGPGPVDVQFRNDAGGALLAGGYRYVAAPSVAAVSPASGPVAGGTAIDVTGSGFTAGDLLYVGALAATQVVVVSATELTAVTPPGAEGPNDVVVADPSGEQGALPAGFDYTAPTRVDAISPSSGSQAGNTRVTLFGAGFLPGATVTIQGHAAPDVAVVDHHTITARTPMGNEGAADVAVASGGTTDTLVAGYTYLDPGNLNGGETGGPMNGTLNVTVMDTYFCTLGGPVPGAHVVVGEGGQTLYQGLTDLRGQVTFSEDALVKPVTVSEWQGDGAPMIVESVATQNLTLYGGQGNIYAWAAGSGGTVLLSFGPSAFFLLPNLGIAEDLYGISAVTPLEALAVGANGAVYDVAQDANSNFKATKIPSNTTQKLLAVTATPAGNFAVGEGGTLLRQAGSSMAAIASGTSAALRAISFGSTVDGVAVGDGGTILVTTNSGNAWSAATSGTSQDLYGVSCATAKRCFAVGKGGTVLATTDLASWTPLATGISDDLTSVLFAESDIAFVAGANGRLARTLDGGATWQVAATGVSGTLYGVGFANPMQGVAVGAGGLVVVTQDAAGTAAGAGAGTTADLHAVSVATGCAGAGGGGGLKPAEIKGDVWGFKLPAGVTLNPGDQEVAIVAVDPASVYYLPPFGLAPTFTELTADGGGYDFQLWRGGRYGVFAYYGVRDTAGHFTPYILGVHRDIEVVGGQVSDGNDVLLDVPLTTTVPLQVVDPPATPGTLDYSVFSYLDLGADGVVPVYDHFDYVPPPQQGQPGSYTPVPASSKTEQFSFAHHPDLAGDAFVFLVQALPQGGNYPISYLYRRQPGDLSLGVQLGPMLPFPTFAQYPNGASWTGPTLSWTFPGAVQPDLGEIDIYGSTGGSYGMYVFPGDQLSLTLPDPIWARLTSDLGGGGTVSWSFTAAHAPRFDYDHWSYGDLYFVDWTSFVIDQRQGTIP